MRWRTVWVKNLARRIEKHLGVAVIFFVLGALVTALASGSEVWAQVWVILTAIAALIPAVRSLFPQKPMQVLVREPLEATRPESVPMVRVARYRGRGPRGVSLVFANAASAPGLVSEVHVYDDQEPMPYFVRGGFLIPAGGEKIETIPFDVKSLKGGAITFYFQYGPTGETHHRLFLPYTIRTARRREATEEGSSSSLFRTYDQLFFELDGQRLESGEKVEKGLAETRRFWRHNPLRVVDVRPLPAKEEPDGSS